MKNDLKKINIKLLLDGVVVFHRTVSRKKYEHTRLILDFLSRQLIEENPDKELKLNLQFIHE